MLSKKQVDRAGDTLRSDKISASDALIAKMDAINILSQWRARHVYPLNLAFNLLKRYTDKIGNNAIYGQRLKRVTSVIHKLKRMPETKLSRLQDIGGCRVILSDYERLRNLTHSLAKSKSILDNYKDYITYPKPDGYRSVHFIYECNSSNTEFDKLKIEIQLRTKLQHAWATTVEIIDSFENQGIKLGGGSDDWRRFFYLVADEFARLEKLPFHDNVTTQAERIAEIIQLASNLNVIFKLEQYSKIIDNMSKLDKFERIRYFIIVLKAKDSRTDIFGYFDDVEAENNYKQMEKSNLENPDVNIVLVKADSLKKIKQAYPNYFADSRKFVSSLELILSK